MTTTSIRVDCHASTITPPARLTGRVIATGVGRHHGTIAAMVCTARGTIPGTTRGTTPGTSHGTTLGMIRGIMAAIMVGRHGAMAGMVHTIVLGATMAITHLFII